MCIVQGSSACCVLPGALSASRWRVVAGRERWCSVQGDGWRACSACAALRGARRLASAGAGVAWSTCGGGACGSVVWARRRRALPALPGGIPAPAHRSALLRCGARMMLRSRAMSSMTPYVEVRVQHCTRAACARLRSVGVPPANERRGHSGAAWSVNLSGSARPGSAGVPPLNAHRRGAQASCPPAHVVDAFPKFHCFAHHSRDCREPRTRNSFSLSTVSVQLSPLPDR